MAPIRGVILAGGFSRRMGCDKASLVLDGRTLLARTIRLLHELELAVTICARSTQDLATAGCEFLDDPVPSIGPAGGLLTAMQAHPESALLTLAVDLPRLRIGTLQRLVDQRNPTCDVTAFQNPEDGRVDPLCALYEPSCAERIRRAVAQGELSLRRILEQSARAHLIRPQRPEDLIDLDTPESMPNLESRPIMSTKRVHIRYFAQIREQRGISEESISTEATDAAGLYRDLAARHGFTLPAESLKVAVNEGFAPWGTILQEGDTIVFLPPVAGG